MDYEDLLTKALAAAKQAADIEETTNGHNWFPCGFAWVTIPGNSPLARHCRKQLSNNSGPGNIPTRDYGDKGYPSGWQFWCPGARLTQRMATYEAAAKAFAKVLTDAGLEATSGSRAD